MKVVTLNHFAKKHKIRKPYYDNRSGRWACPTCRYEDAVKYRVISHISAFHLSPQKLGRGVIL